jgi:hypothetical protein
MGPKWSLVGHPCLGQSPEQINSIIIVHFILYIYYKYITNLMMYPTLTNIYYSWFHCVGVMVMKLKMCSSATSISSSSLLKLKPVEPMISQACNALYFLLCRRWPLPCCLGPLHIWRWAV